MLAGAAVRLDQGARAPISGSGSARRSQAGSSCPSAAPGSSPTATSRPASRSCASSCTASASSRSEFGCRCREFWSPGRVRLLRPAAAADAPRRHHAVPDAEALVESLQPAGRTTRSSGRAIDGSEVLGALPAGRHLQQRRDASRSPARRARVQGSRVERGRACSCTGTATAAAARRARCSSRCAARATCKACRAPRMATSDEFFEALEAEAADRARRRRRAVLRVPPRRLHVAGVRRSAATGVCEQVLHDAEFLASGARRLPARRARPALEAPAPPAVPRHPARLVDRPRLRRRPTRLRRARVGARGARRPRPTCP